MAFPTRVWLAGALSLSSACGDDASSSDDGSSTGNVDGSGTAASAASTTAPPATATSGGTGSDGSEGTTTAVATTDADASGDGSGSTGSQPNFADPRGYTLISPLNSRFSYLMDADGMEINHWEAQTTPANIAYLLPNGHLLRVSRDPNPAVELVSGAGGVVQEFAWDGHLVWEYDYVGPTIVAHHDIEPMPNGHVLIVAYEMHDFDEAVAMGADPAEVSPEGRWSDHVVEVDPATDQIVWEWHVWDHLVQDFDPMAPNYGDVAASPGRIDLNWTRPGASPRPDWTHTNAIDYRESLDQIILSPRTFSEFWIIDHSTTTAEAATSAGGSAGHGGDLLYRFGNPEASQAGDPMDRQLFFQHHPHWLDDDDRVLIFDNGDDTLRPWSRVVEIETPLLGDGNYDLTGPFYGPAMPTWEYESPDDFYASFISGADRISDGNTLITDGPAGRLFEIDVAGNVVWEYLLETAAFRAERHEADDPAFTGLSREDLAPKGPLVIDFSP